MNIQAIPNRLLLRIFESLSFQDAIQCALVCRKFNEIIVSNFSYYYIDQVKEVSDRAPPEFIQLLRSCTVKVDETFVLKCKVTGALPQPSIKWTRDGKEIEMSPRVRTEFREDGTLTLTVNRTQTTDAGEYRCFAENESGSAWTEARVVVVEVGEEKPSADAPDFLQPIKPVVVVEGETAVLEGSISGQPKLTVKWYKDGKQLADCERLRIENCEDGTQRLTIRDSTKYDQGEYRCEASNEYGDVWSDVTLTVKDRCKSGEFHFIYACSTCLFAFRADRVELFEYHPFVRRLYRTAISSAFRPGFCFHKNLTYVVPNTATIAYVDVTAESKDLVFYDVKRSKELARRVGIDLDMAESRLFHIFNEIAILDCDKTYFQCVAYPRFGSEVQKRRADEVHCSPSRPMLYRKVIARAEDGMVTIFDWRSIPKSIDKGVSPPVREVEESGKNVQTREIGSPTQKIDIVESEELCAFDVAGKLLVTAVRSENDRVKMLTVYRIKPKTVVFRPDLSEFDIRVETIKFSRDSRFLLLHGKALFCILDLLLRRVFFDTIKPGYVPMIRKIGGEYHLQMLSSAMKFQLTKLDLS